MTVTEAAEILSADAEKDVPLRESIKRIPNVGYFRLAAYLKYNYGACLKGMTQDEDWLQEARTLYSDVLSVG